MTSLFVELPWSRKALGRENPRPSEEAASDRCRAGRPASSENLFRFRREDGLPHAL